VSTFEMPESRIQIARCSLATAGLNLTLKGIT
jgi:hypothetical protein